MEEINSSSSLLLNLNEQRTDLQVGRPSDKKQEWYAEDQDVAKEKPKKGFRQDRNYTKELKRSEDNKTSHNETTHALPFISSLFRHNPEIPVVELASVKQKEEPLFLDQEFKDLKLHPHLVACLRDRFDITKMTAVQQKTIPVLLSGRNALVKSSTGSGKTLAYAIPVIQKLQEITPKLKRSDGIHAVVIAPTRELVIQSYEYFENLCRTFTWLVAGYLIGGEKKKSEKARIRKGLSVLISTPGRLLDHIEHTANLSFSNVKWFIIDEADRLLDMGFQQAILKIADKLKEHSYDSLQTVLLSATLTKEVENLAGTTLTDPAVIDLAANSEDVAMTCEDFVVPSLLEQHFIITPVKLRLITLSSFIVDKLAIGGLKAIVFMATQDVVDFHNDLFSVKLQRLLTDSGYSVLFFKLHGNMHQQERVKVFKEFRDCRAGILLCTDVAARGLDLPCVDWILQYSAPSRAEDYVHRVGRTARIGSKGNALLLLSPSETGFLQLLLHHKASLKEVSLKHLLPSLKLLVLDIKGDGRVQKPYTAEEHATALQLKFENHVYHNQKLLDSARKAFVSYVRSYASYPKNLKEVFPFKSLHLGHVAKSFCLREAPSVLGIKGVEVRSREKHFTKQRPDKGVKRSSLQQFSEFDSGLGQAAAKRKKTTKKSKVLKKPRKSQFR